MPSQNDNKPKRRRPVVEEVVETPPAPQPTPEPVSVPEPVVTEPAVEPAPTPVPAIVEPVNSQDTEKKAEEVLQSLETAHKEHRNNNRKFSLKLLFALTVLIALVIGFIAGGLYVYTTGMQNANSEEVEPEESLESIATPEPTPSPSPTPEPVDISELTVSVLNGSGVIGAAGNAENLLEDAGFTVGNTGNASRFNYTDTVIQVKEDVPQSVIDQLEETLSEDYSVEIGDNLPDTSQYDIVVTVGRDSN